MSSRSFAEKLCFLKSAEKVKKIYLKNGFYGKFIHSWLAASTKVLRKYISSLAKKM